MKHEKKYYQTLHKKKDLNGFKWYAAIKDSSGSFSHYFEKHTENIDNDYLKIRVSEEDIENGNLEIMCKNSKTTKDYLIYVNNTKYAEVNGHQALIEHIEQIRVERGEGAKYTITLHKI